jgi:hypothetical protein
MSDNRTLNVIGANKKESMVTVKKLPNEGLINSHYSNILLRNFHQGV